MNLQRLQYRRLKRSTTPAIEPLELRQLLSGVVVNTVADTTDPTGSSTVSLRDAVAIANASSTDTGITFDPTVFAAAQTITLGGSSLSLTSGAAITITGSAAGVTINGNNQSSVFYAAASGQITLTNLTITGGNTTGYGGGINNQYSPLTLIGDTIVGNHSSDVGGGINTGGTLTMIDDTITGNSSDSSGGGLWDENDSALVTDCTIVNNVAGGDGGGIANHGATMTLTNSIVAGNTNGSGNISTDVAGAFESAGFNLIGKTDGSNGWLAQDLTGTVASPLDPQLGALTDNSGPTATMLPEPGSPAINAGSNDLVPVEITTDQRGLSRIYNGTVDLGAVEVQPIPPRVVTKSIGGLDPSFGNNGLASHNVGFTTTSGVATDGTQSILIGPIGTSPNQAFGVTRYNSDGSLDTTFGTGGVVTTHFGSTDAVPTAVQVLSDGHILVAGTATEPGGGSAFALAEYNADGSLNASFGTGGEATASFSAAPGTFSNDIVHAMAVGTDGTIYLAGSSDAAGAGNGDLAVAAFTSAGVVDTSFGTNGFTTIDVNGGDDQINSLAVESSGDLIAAGSATVGGVTQVALARLLPSGAVDKKFSGGVVTTAVGSVYDSASSVLVQPKGQIIIGGLTANGSGASLTSDFLVQRYTATGKLDRSFGGGSVVTSFGQPAAVTQILLQSDGSVVASGRTSATLGGTLDVAIARLTPKGSLDTSLAGTGKVVIDLGVGVIATPAMAAAESNLGTAFDAFTASLQGVVAVTQGGEILTAGSSGANTVEAELVAAGIDLVTAVLSSLPKSVLAGAKGSVQVTITESGTTAVKGSATIEIDFATDAAGDSAAPARSIPAKLSLKQGQAKTYKLTFNFPTGLANGDYFLIAKVTNGTGLPADLNESNNAAAAASSTTIAPAFVALAGADLSSSTVVAGKPATINLTITNTGNVTAKGKTEVDFYLSTDHTVVAGTSLGVAPLAVSLPAGRSKVYRLKVVAASAISVGTFNLLGVIDPNNLLGTDDVLVVSPTPVVVG